MGYIFVIKDKDNYYVTKSCLYKNKSGEIEYCPSKNYINGCGGFTAYEWALEDLEKLNKKNNTYKFGQEFRIEKIDVDEVIKEELNQIYNKIKIHNK